MSQMNPKDFDHNTAYSVQLPYIASLSLYDTYFFKRVRKGSWYFFYVFSLNNIEYKSILIQWKQNQQKSI